ncbi:PREDICTED: general negative regulator of transcription subunit 3-like [Tarenaya hassleriana]|uniref:general negative regulator of transcription subunit 3-like n=2 Tax=Tarenaya hassleriana TaxID=28532 RepID=UPI00053C0C9B|nr:PREDICTED: general negative regulator of transcription subunit 3-like [Tarenaya hassleriana]
MGATRKLQGEIDRVLKKVQEGVEVFDSIWNKVYDTDNANQKEKFEADLKKEIKKLQRYRDQIKTWIQSSEIKDKKVSASYEQALVDARKLIEREMERFKICEKETKTKAFSKEGLGQQPKTDPKEKAKSETREWLNSVVGELEQQIDSFEAELEGLTVKKGKTRPPRLTHLETSITRHKAHIMKLELILRLLDNDELSPEQVNDIKDFLDDYVERNQDDFDEFSDVDELYSSLPLDKVESLEDLVTTGPLVKGTPISSKNSLAASASITPSTVTSTRLQSTFLEQTEDKASTVNSDSIPKTPLSKISTAAASQANEAQATPISVNVPSQSLTVTTKFTENSVNSLSPVSPSIAKGEDVASLPGRRLSPSLVRNSISIQSPSPIPLSPGGGPSGGAHSGVPLASETAKRNTLEIDSRLGNNTSGQPPMSPLSNRMMLPHAAKSNDVTSVIDVNQSEASVIAGRAFSPSTISGMQWRPGSPFQNQSETGQFPGRPEIVPDQKEIFLHRLQQVQQQSHGNLLGMSHLTGGNSKPMSTQQQNPLLQQGSSMTPQGGPGSRVQLSGLTNNIGLQQQSSFMQEQLSQQLMSDIGTLKHEEMQQNLHQDPIPEPASKTIEADLKPRPISPVSPPEPARAVEFSPGEPIQPNQVSGNLGAIGRRSAADLGAIGDGTSASPVNSGEIHDRRFRYQMLEAALKRLPLPKDSERPRQYSPRRPAATPPSYPQVQAPIINNPMFWERLSNDTLFFAFYHQQNTYQQYLAAKELKKQAWRFHKKLNTWFQRHDEPKIATDEYEQGAYVFFDYNVDKDGQHGWCSMIKHDFAFEYQYLEDELGA